MTNTKYILVFKLNLDGILSILCQWPLYLIRAGIAF